MSSLMEAGNASYAARTRFKSAFSRNANSALYKRKQWLIGLKLDQPILDPLGISITSKIKIVPGQYIQKLRVSRIQARPLFPGLPWPVPTGLALGR